MSQISPPVRILAVAAVALLATYMAVLRPKSSTETLAPAPTPAGNVHTGKPAVTRFGKAVQAAQGAAKATEDQMNGDVGETAPSGSPAHATAATRSSSSPSTSRPPSAPAADLRGLPRPVARAVRHHEVLALLFWNGRSPDDRAVHAALRQVDRFRGAVYVHSVRMQAIGRYGRITQGADVQQSPTVVVVDRRLRATTLVGYVDADTIEQAVVDALRSSGGIFSDPYLRRVNKMCSATVHDLYAIPHPMTIPQARHDIGAMNGRWDRFVSAFRAVPAPARWRSFKRATLRDLRAAAASDHRLERSLQHHPTASSVRRALAGDSRVARPVSKRFYRRMDRVGLIFCGSRD